MVDTQTILILSFLLLCFCAVWVIYLAWLIEEKYKEIDLNIAKINRLIEEDYTIYSDEYED